MMLEPQDLAALVAAHRLEPCGIVLRSLDGPRPSVVHVPETTLYPASMIKTPLVAVVLAEAAAGRFRLCDPVVISEANMTYNDADSPLVPGYRSTVEEICELAIRYSDNVATNELFDLVGRERATAVAREQLGLANTAFFRKLSGSEPLIADPGWDGTHRNTHPPSDAARLFTAIADERIAHASILRAMLDAQAWNDKLTRGLRAGDRFAHKTGGTDDVTHDGGILHTVEGRRYVLVVYTGHAASETNDARLASFAEALRASL